MRKNALSVAIIIAVLAIATSLYFYSELRSLKTDPAKISAEEVQKLVSKVGEIIVLPQGETPTVATVTDPEALRSQAFFAQAAKGDKVLLFTNARKAILYRPDTNKIVEVAPINIGSNAAPAPTPSKSGSSQ
jgi:hypothetical protein